MSNLDPKLPAAPHANEDPLTHEPGAHPVATGVGAVGGGATGAAIGMAVGGPVGSVIGAVIGAVAGGLGGSAVGESIDPTIENESWPGEQTHLREQQAADLAAVEAPEAVILPAASLEGALQVHGTSLEAQDEPLLPENPAPSHEMIATHAWAYYEAEGKPEGHDLQHWYQAEKDLQGNDPAGESQKDNVL